MNLTIISVLFFLKRPQQNVFLMEVLNIDISSNNMLGQELINSMQCFNVGWTSNWRAYPRIWHNWSYLGKLFWFSLWVWSPLECDITDRHIILSSFQIEKISKALTKKFTDPSDVSIHFQCANSKLELELASYTENEANFNDALEIGFASFTRDLYNIYDMCCPIRTKTLTS